MVCLQAPRHVERSDAVNTTLYETGMEWKRCAVGDALGGVVAFEVSAPPPI